MSLSDKIKKIIHEEVKKTVLRGKIEEVLSSNITLMELLGYTNDGKVDCEKISMEMDKLKGDMSLDSQRKLYRLKKIQDKHCQELEVRILENGEQQSRMKHIQYVGANAHSSRLSDQELQDALINGVDLIRTGVNQRIKSNIMPYLKQIKIALVERGTISQKQFPEIKLLRSDIMKLSPEEEHTLKIAQKIGVVPNSSSDPYDIAYDMLKKGILKRSEKNSQVLRPSDIADFDEAKNLAGDYTDAPSAIRREKEKHEKDKKNLKQIIVKSKEKKKEPKAGFAFEEEKQEEAKDPPWASWDQVNYQIKKGTPANPYLLTKKKKKKDK